MYLHVFIVICSALLRVCSIKSFGFLVNSQYQVASDKCSNRTTTYTDFLLLMTILLLFLLVPLCYFILHI